MQVWKFYIDGTLRVKTRDKSEFSSFTAKFSWALRAITSVIPSRLQLGAMFSKPTLPTWVSDCLTISRAIPCQSKLHVITRRSRVQNKVNYNLTTAYVTTQRNKRLAIQAIATRVGRTVVEQQKSFASHSLSSHCVAFNWHYAQQSSAFDFYSNSDIS